MKPLYLEMTAFGCYAEKTAVPFEKFKHGLYLVTGDTGAGKTTIFDAIVFALFGVASGSEREAEMLHSDHVDKSVDTVVMLRFEQDGREYTVERTLHYPKSRDPRKESKMVKSAVLTEPDGRAPTKDVDKVKKRCEELLGLNAEQFRKIIMLAQGEFREFLTAPSKNKGEILGQLFDSSPYKWYQNLLINANRKLDAQRAESRRDLESLMTQAFTMPPECDAALYQPTTPELLENLLALTEAEDAALKESQRQRDEQDTAVKALHTKRGAAEGVNRQLGELEANRLKLEGLEGQREDYARRQEALTVAEKALHRAKPAIDKANEADALVKRTRGEIEGLKTDIAARNGEVEAAQAQVDADAPVKRKIDALTGTLQVLDGQMPRYRELSEQVDKQAKAAKAAQEAAKIKQQKTDEQEAANAKLAQLKEELDALSSVDAEVVERQTALNQAAKRFEGVNGLTDDVKTLQKTAADLKRAEGELARRTAAASEAGNASNDLYQRFIADQAGLLAKDLRDKLTEAGEATCPVCGSALCREHIPNLAPLSVETPDKAAVDAARAEAERLEKSRADQHTKVETLRERQQKEREAAEEHARNCQLPDFTGWEQLVTGDYLASAIKSAKAKSDQCASNLKDAEERQTRRKKLLKEQREKEEALKKLQADIKDAEEKERKQDTEAKELAAAIKTLKAQLPYEDESAAQAEMKRQSKQKNELDRQVRAHENALNAAKDALNTLNGTRVEKESALERQTRDAEDARAAMRRALADNGFSVPAEVDVALAPMTGEDGEKWLARERKAITDYDNEIRHTGEAVKKLEKDTEGKTMTDMEDLNAQINAAETAWKARQEACEATARLLDNHQTTLARATELRRALAATDGAFNRLNRLATLAGGESGEGGKLSFERHVMGVVFRDILEQANIRLDRMSGGRYELQQGSADRSNTQAGFEIAVVDNDTGKMRDTKSLSGGEGFFTSMALALGLSDVVQSHAGGRQMDALFIDEGFGTLDNDVLDKALEVLNQLTEGNRLVGIISHVDRLDESIPQKIRVRRGERGSRIDLPELG